MFDFDKKLQRYARSLSFIRQIRTDQPELNVELALTKVLFIIRRRQLLSRKKGVDLYLRNFFPVGFSRPDSPAASKWREKMIRFEPVVLI